MDSNHSITESSLIAALESPSCTALYDRFSIFLNPFSDFLSLDGPDASQKTVSMKTEKNVNSKKKKKKKDADPSSIRPLAKQFLPFLSRVLKILPSRLSSKEDNGNAPELLRIYRLALGCLTCISPCLAGKPYSVHLQRALFLRCLEASRQYGEAEREGLSILESLRAVVLAPESQKAKRVEVGLLPDLPAEKAADPELGTLVVEVVVCVISCVSKGGSKEGVVYQNVLELVGQVAPWLRVLNSESYKKFHRALVSSLYKCTLFMVGDPTCFNTDLINRVCMATLTECLQSSMKDQFPKLAHRICSSISLQWDGRSSLFLDILRCALESIPRKCEVQIAYNVNDVLDFVYYCSDNIRIESTDICRNAAKFLKTLASEILQVSTLIASILNLYAVALYFVGSDVEARGRHSIPVKGGSRMALFLNNGDNLRCLASLGLLANYFHFCGKNNQLLFGHTEKEMGDSSCIACKSNIKVMECKQMDGDVSVFSYINALDFLCKPFAEYVNSAWKHCVSENEAGCLFSNIKYVQDAFNQFCDVFLTAYSNKSEREKERWHESRRTLFHVAMASFRVSLMTDKSTQKSMNSIDCIISREWIQPQELKFLSSSLYNIGVSLYNIKQMEKASMAFSLCYQALWAQASLICQKFPEKGIHDDHLSEDAILDIVTDACAKSAIFLDVLHQCDSPAVNDVIVSSLLKWSSAINMLKRPVVPMVLVKQWVKIVCKDVKNVNVENDVPSLYSLLSSSSAKCSEMTLGMILEQELVAYAEMDARNPSLCQRMQLKILNILLCNVYITKDYNLQRSRVLVKKAGLLRAGGIDGLNGCIQCLSEAISILSDTSGVPSCSNASCCHQLALTYCLHALCTQEADQNSEVILQDIRSALKLWTHISSHFLADDGPEWMTENVIPMLHHVADLLSLKGYINLQLDIYKMIVILYKWKGVPLERCLSMLWEDRRLNHALCISPIDETFILNFSQEFGIFANSIDFWISCIEGSPPLLLGFYQKLLLCDSFSSQAGVLNTKISKGLDITVDKVKEAASNLISSSPLPSHSAFLAGYLYYDLCERLFSSGQLFEALLYAKEALRLRTRLLQRKYLCSFGQQSTKIMETDETEQQGKCNKYTHIEAIRSVVTAIWPDAIKTWNAESTVLSPWTVIKCFLESALQVGTIHEAIGNGAEAEAILLVGKRISCLQGSLPFQVAFASLLGRIYCKKQNWDESESELNSAKQILLDSGAIISCKRCKFTWEATVDMHIGDLIRSRLHTMEGQSHKNSSRFLGLYGSALEKLNLAEIGNLFMCRVTNSDSILSGQPVFEEADCGVCKTVQSSVRKQRSVICENPGNCNSQHDGPKQTDIGKQSCLIVDDEESRQSFDARKSKKSKNSSKHVTKKQTVKTERNSGKTCASGRCSRSKIVRVEGEEDHELAKHSYHGHEFACTVTHSQRGQQSQVNWNFAADFGCENNEHGSMQDFINMNWECHRRRLLLTLLRKIGKCTRLHGDFHEVHKIFWQSICVLSNRNPFCQAHSYAPDLLELIEKENPSNIFAIERAAVLYDISWFTVKNIQSKHSRTYCCLLSDIPLSRIVMWLFQAFILCRDLPPLFHKVSKLLATIFLLSAFAKSFSLPLFTGKALSTSHWASYFHQASVGTYMHHQYLSSMKDKLKSGNSMTHKGSCHAGSVDGISGAFGHLRFVPEKLEDLEGFVTNFFENLPGVPIICLSMVGGSYSSVIGEILLSSSPCPAWMLLSRFHSVEQPVIMFLPVYSVVEEDLSNDANNGMESITKCELSRKWVCPWGDTVVDDVAPQFRWILEENYLSTTSPALNDTQTSRFIWWTRRNKLNDRLDKFLRSMESSWLGPWRCLLLGDRLNCGRLDIVVRKLICDLKSRCDFEIHESIIKAVLGNVQSLAESEICVSQLLLYKGYLGRGECCGKDIFGSVSSCDETGSVHGLPGRLMLEAIGDMMEEAADREPVVLVLDANVQMLPWENLPILRKWEVYRMPSVISISVALKRSCGHQEQVSEVAAMFPSIDPSNAYYLLNPSGDLGSTQIEFEEWFNNQKWEGEAGNVPPTEELALALQNHDLFIYFGHGSGIQYIPGHEIQKLDQCAATLLMGCSSGSLCFTGSYAPQGAPLSYILAGSPAIIANLWDVTDKDIDRFAKVILGAWLQEESECTNCFGCNNMVEEFGCMSLANKRNAKASKSRKNALKQKTLCVCKKHNHTSFGGKPRIASFMSRARDACRLPHLIGASPVCYGVPTTIRRSHSKFSQSNSH